MAEAPVRQRKQHFKTEAWFLIMLDDIETESGGKSTLWHLEKLQGISRRDFYRWIYEIDTHVASYRLTRLWFAVKICRITKGLGIKDQIFYRRRVEKLIPEQYRTLELGALGIRERRRRFAEQQFPAPIH